MISLPSNPRIQSQPGVPMSVSGPSVPSTILQFVGHKFSSPGGAGGGVAGALTSRKGSGVNRQNGAFG